MWVGGQMLTSAKKGKKYISLFPWLDKLTKSLSSFWFIFLDLPKISCNLSLPASVAMRSLGSLTEDKSIGWINALRLRITWKFWCWSTSFPVPELRLLLRLLQPIGCKWYRKRNQIVAWWKDNCDDYLHHWRLASSRLELLLPVRHSRTANESDEQIIQNNCKFEKWLIQNQIWLQNQSHF